MNKYLFFISEILTINISNKAANPLRVNEMRLPIVLEKKKVER